MCGLDTIEGFAIFGVGFSADVVGDASFRHEVAFVGGVDEYFGWEGFAGLGDDFVDACVLFHNT